MKYFRCMYKIKEGTIEDAFNIWQLIEKTWIESGIGNFENRELLQNLKGIYSKEKVAIEIEEKIQCYLIIYEQNNAVAFASYSFTEHSMLDFRIHKIYNLKYTQGKGYIKILINRIEQIALSKNGSHLFIHISRQSRKKEYLEALGFKLYISKDKEEEISKIIEYVMYKKLSF